MSSLNKKLLITACILVLLVVSIGGILYWWRPVGQTLVTDPAAQREAVRLENEALLLQVQQHILLPGNEAPTVAVIDNAQELASEQDFFKNSQDGDKLLIYPQAKRAFIYSPSRDVIVAAGPTFFD